MLSRIVVVLALAVGVMGCPSKPTPPPEPPPVAEPEQPPEPPDEPEPPVAEVPDEVAPEETPPEPTAEPPKGTELVGVIRKKGASTWVLEGSGRWCMRGPLFTAAFQKDGLRVRVRGVRGKIPPNVRMACTPFALSVIEAVE